MADHTHDLTPVIFDGLHERARKLGLLQHADTARTFASINPARPRSIDRKLFTLLDERVRRFAQHLRDTNAFASATPPLQVNGISLGVECETGLSLNAPLPALTRHTLITAPSGGTKTVYAHFLVLQARARGTCVWIADPKLDAKYLAAQDEDFLIIERETPFNLLQPLSFIDRAAHIHLLAHCFAKTHFGGEHTMQVVEIALTKAYEQHAVPCFADVLSIVESLAPKGSTYGWVDAVRGVLHKLWRLRDRYPVAFATRACNLDVLFGRSLYVPLLFQSTSDEFVFATLAHFLFLHHYRAGIRELTTLVLYDEGLTGWSSKPANIDQAPVLATLQVQLREMGIGMIVTSAAISMTSALLKSNVHTRVTMGAGNPLDIEELTRTFQFTTEQRDYLLTRITPGQAIVKIGTDVPRLVTFPNITADKRLPADVWQTALHRSELLRRAVPPLQLIAAAREGIGHTGQPTPPQQSAPSSSPPARVAPVVDDTTSHNTKERSLPHNTRRVALNKHAMSLLQDVADHPFTLCTFCYKRCGLLLAQGDRARAQAERLGFLRATRVTCGRGRGKAGIALSLSAEAWRQVLGRTPTKGLRGGSSVQHSFCVFELQRRIPGSHIEEYLDAKAVDLAIPFNTELHEPFYRAIAALTGKTPHLENGDIIGLEVEISAPAKSAARNALKNADAGVALTILAIADRQPERLALILPPNAIVLDVYALLDALRPTEDR